MHGLDGGRGSRAMEDERYGREPAIEYKYSSKWMRITCGDLEIDIEKERTKGW